MAVPWTNLQIEEATDKHFQGRKEGGSSISGLCTSPRGEGSRTCSTVLLRGCRPCGGAASGYPHCVRLKEGGFFHRFHPFLAQSCDTMAQSGG